MSDEPLAAGCAEPSGREVYPSELRDRDWWVNWVKAYPYHDGSIDRDAKPTKQPVAPYDNGDAKPVLWNSGLDDDEHPSTTFVDVVDWDGLETGTDIETAERVVSDELGIGIIIPVGGGEGEPITLLDWDDVRDPETGELHAVCAEALREYDGFAEISQSGEGVHQFIKGEIPGGLSKFLRHIDDEPFVGDSLPMVEMYCSGRLTAMTGDHVAGCGDDVVADQELIDDLCWEFGTADNNSPGTPTDPFGRRSEADDDGERPSHEEVSEALREAAAFDGEHPKNWEIPDEWSLRYAAVVRARENGDELAHIANWELNGYAGAIGYHDGHDLDDIVADLGEVCDDNDLRREVRQAYRKADAGNYEQPSLETLTQRGLLPEDFADDTTADAEGADAEADGGDDDTSNKWSYARTLYADDDVDDGKARLVATDAVEDETSFMQIVETEAVWKYNADRGYYEPLGEHAFDELLESRLGVHFSARERNEILLRLKSRNKVTQDEVNAADADDPLLCVGNGVVNLRTGERRRHDADDHFIRGLRWDYDPDADSTAVVDKFLAEITEREADWKTLVDHLAHGLMPGHPFRAFVMTYGPGGNGKTQLGELFRGFVGADNAAAVELQDFASDDFATGDLPGAFINVGDDVSIGEVRDTSTLKTLTGGATARANNKNEKQFDFKNEAAMFFSANEPPRFAESKRSIDDRLYPVRMPFKFVNDPDPEDRFQKSKTSKISNKLLDDREAMRGFLALVVERAQRLIETSGNYAMPEGPAARRERYEAASDPILRFVVECLEDAEIDDVVLKDDAYTVYSKLCDRDDDRPATEQVFKRKVTQQTTVDVQNTQTRQLTPGDDRVTAWKFVRFDEDATELMPSRLVSRYFPGHEQADVDDVVEESDDDTEEQTVDDPDRAAFGAVPINDAAETLTGYVTVTAEIVNAIRLGETDSGCKAILKDASGAIDFVSWDAAMNERIHELVGETVAIRNAEVSEYDGSHQLAPVEALTTIETIDAGAGFTVTMDPEEADGVDQDGSEYEGAKAQVHEYLRETGDSASIPELAGFLSEDPDKIREAAESLKRSGRIVERSGQYALE
jgi:putative DNA primase/helicase